MFKYLDLKSEIIGFKKLKQRLFVFTKKKVFEITQNKKRLSAREIYPKIGYRKINGIITEGW